MRALIRRAGPRVDNLASVMYPAAGLAFRYAWVDAGRASAADHAAVAAMGRGRQTLRRVSLAIERRVRRAPQ